VDRLQRIGNWGRADEALGRRWEEVGIDALRPLVGRPRPIASGAFVPRTVLALAEDEALRHEIHRSGLPNPDACLLGVGTTGAPILQPVDFKWSLERARLPQVSAETIAGLLQAELPGVRAVLDQALGGLGLPADDLSCVDGFFFAPEHAENHAYLAGPANARAEFPLTPADVYLWRVAPEPFFAPLPGWDVACWLVGVDRSPGLLQTIEGADRYFRLGAGFAGAVRRLATPLFEPPPASVDVTAELERLRREHRLANSIQLANHLERLMTARDELARRLRDLEAALYPFRQLRLDVAHAVAVAPADDAAPTSLRQRYRVAQAAVRDWLAREGRALVQRGQPPTGALEALETRAAELAPSARTLARRAVGLPAGDGPPARP
jgi:hypothetical protein